MDPLRLTTSDPRFDPAEPIEVNGYLYIPAERQLRPRRPVITRPPSRTAVVIERRRTVEVERG